MMESTQPEQTTVVLQKLQLLSPERLRDVEDFIDYLQQRDENRELVQAAMNNAESTFERVWNNEEDAEYDQL